MNKVSLASLIFLFACCITPATPPPHSKVVSVNPQAPLAEVKAVVISAPISQPITQSTSICGANMAEVNGDYCPTLLHKCLEWRDKDTQKVCLRYQPNYAQCTGHIKHLHFCVDQYEIPNIKGVKPQLGMTYYEAENFCKAQGKRLGTDQEWTLAAEGNDRTPYPHSWERKENWCAWDKPYIIPNWNKLYQSGPVRDEEMRRLDQSDLTGSHPDCYVEWNGLRVYDMSGNGDEWTRNVSLGGRPWVGLLKGGYWGKGLVRNRARPYTESHGPTFNGYEVSSRCFKDTPITDKDISNVQSR